MHKIKLNWSGGEHEFALGMGELRALQDAVNAGPEQILQRIISGEWRVDDLMQTLRLGLIGSGEMTNKDAGPLVAQLFDERPIIEFKLVAQAVLIAALVGPEDDQTGEPVGVTESPENGNSPKSMDPAP